MVLTPTGGGQLLGGNPLRYKIPGDCQSAFAGEFPVVFPFAFPDRIRVRMSDDPDFFVPLHGKHLTEWALMVLPYLGLPPGWRFLITEGYEDVWEDPGLEKDTI